MGRPARPWPYSLQMALSSPCFAAHARYVMAPQEYHVDLERGPPPQVHNKEAFIANAEAAIQGAAFDTTFRVLLCLSGLRFDLPALHESRECGRKQMGQTAIDPR